VKKLLSFIMSLILLIGVAGCTSTNEIVFADAQWDSIQFHNAVAGFIAVEAFDYDKWSELSATTPATHLGLINGEIDVHMEEWADNIPSYADDLEAGEFVELGINFDDNFQGLYVPRYVIEGDAERGIEPMAPNLKTVEDLKDYAHIFPDEDDSSKGRIYGAIPGWEVDEILRRKVEYMKLDEQFVYFNPGSEFGLASAFTNAYENGEAIVGYYWEPTWLMGLYDFVLLEDEPFTTVEDFQAGKTEMPPMDIRIAVSNDFYERDPEFSEFLSNYYSTSALISEALAYTQEHNVDFTETAKWYLRENDSMIDEWLDSERAQMVRDALAR